MIIISTSLITFSQEKNLKEQALEEFKNENYTKSIELLKQAEKETPDDPEVYYYLGYFCHYLAYDSRPLKGYTLNWSDLVLQYLNKAISLKPDYGDAFYFLGAEYGGRARQALLEGDIERCIKEYKNGHKYGGNPDWMIELGRNMLKSCERDAILFTAGDADLNAIHYLQFVEGYRRDVSVFPEARLGTPWFVKFMKKGVADFIPPVPISWSDHQIYSMSPYKWKTNTIEIPYSQNLLADYNIISSDSVMSIEIAPDLESKSRSYLSPAKALLIDIIETNAWERPIYFPVLAVQDTELLKFYQLCGLTYKLMPVITQENGISINTVNIEKILLNKDSYQNLETFPETDMPRSSNMLNGYRWILMRLAEHYYKKGDANSGDNVINKMKEYIPKEIVPLPEYYEKWLEEIKKTE